VAEATSAFAARQSARYGATAAARRRPGPQEHSWWKISGMLQTTSAERRAAGGDRPRSVGVSDAPKANRASLAALRGLADHIIELFI